MPDTSYRQTLDRLNRKDIYSSDRANYYQWLGYQAYLKKKQEEEEKDREKKEKEEAYQRFLDEMFGPKDPLSLPSIDTSSKLPDLPSKKDDRDSLLGRAGDFIKGIPSKVSGIIEDAGTIREDTGLDPLQFFVRSTGSLVDSAIPFVDPVKDGLVKRFDDWEWLQETFQDTDNQFLNFTDNVAGFVGNLVPGVGAYKVADRIVSGAKSASKLARPTVKRTTKDKVVDEAAKGALTGAMWSTQNEVGEQLGGRRESLAESLQNIARDTALGAVADPAIAGLFGAFRRTPMKVSASEITPTEQVADALTAERPSQSHLQELVDFFNQHNADTSRLARTSTASLDTPTTPTPTREFDPERMTFGFDRTVGEPESLMTRKDRTIQRVTDDLHGIKITEELASGDNKFYQDARRVRGATAASELYVRQTLEPAIKSFRGSSDELRNALVAIQDKHLERIMTYNPEYKAPGGKTLEEIRANVQRYNNDPRTQQLAQQIRTFQRGLLDMLTDSGVISKKTRDDLIKTYPDYIPLFRQDEMTLDDIFDSYSRLNTGNVRKALYELSEYGSEKLTKDPLSNLIQYAINVHHASFTNVAMNNIKALNGVKVNGVTLAQEINPHVASKYSKKNIVKFFDNGKEKVYYVNDDLKRSLDNLKDVFQFDEVLKLWQKVTQVQRQAITANPIFTARQLFRDIPQAYAVGDFSFTKDLLPAFLDTISKGRFFGDRSMYTKFIEHGGGMSTIIGQDRNKFLALQKAVDRMDPNRGFVKASLQETGYVLKQAMDMIRRFNEALEEAPKVAQFRATYRRTNDADLAAYQGRDIMDFARSGESIRTINRLAAFVNANIQGKSKQFRALFSKENKGNRINAFLRTASVGAIPSAVAYMAYESYASDKQKQLINEAPEWLRQTNWLIPDPSDSERIITLPKPYEVATIISTPLEFLLYNQDKVGSSFADGLREWFNQAVVVDPSLTALTPVFELGFNKDAFTGQEIVPRSEQELPAREQYDVNTGSVARFLGELSGISPRQIDHAVRGFFPMTGEHLSDLVDRGLEATGIRENQKPTGTDSLSNLNFLTMRDENRHSPLIGNIYDTQREVQAMKKQTQDSGEYFPYHNAYAAMNQYVQNDKELAQLLRSIDNDPNLTGDEKAHLRQQVIDQRNQAARSAQQHGVFDTSEENLARLEQWAEPLGRGETKTDLEQRIVSRLVEAGVPEYMVTQIISQAKDFGLDETQIVEQLTRLLERFQQR